MQVVLLLATVVRTLWGDPLDPRRADLRDEEKLLFEMFEYRRRVKFDRPSKSGIWRIFLTWVLRVTASTRCSGNMPLAFASDRAHDYQHRVPLRFLIGLRAK
ncbi:hypothetical protein C8Q80DRAFT_631033 [Daedaleopsis nitida]|nr:hypothetical protein C8Q80DRAFT_631033 [Daedaleopsis nitida]